MSKNVLWVVALLPQRLKSTLFEIFLTPLASSGPLRSKFFPKMLILAFEANSTLSRENETQIVKTTHSVLQRTIKKLLMPIGAVLLHDESTIFFVIDF